MTYRNFKFDVDADGIALVTWDMPERSMNVIDFTLIEEFNANRRQVASDVAIKGAVVTSARTRSAAVPTGRCWRSSATTKTHDQVEGRGSRDRDGVSSAARALPGLPQLEPAKPWVAALNGTAMGGCFEMALACHYRVAGDNPKTRLGLPEIKVGLFPGAGGTQRIARMLAPVDALQLLLKGDQLRLDRAKALKLVDAVVPAADLIKAAKDWIKTSPKSKQPWDADGFKLPGGPGCRRGNDDWPSGTDVRKYNVDNYPAARASAVVFDACIADGRGVRVESRYFAKIMLLPQPPP